MRSVVLPHRFILALLPVVIRHHITERTTRVDKGWCIRTRYPPCRTPSRLQIMPGDAQVSFFTGKALKQANLPDVVVEQVEHIARSVLLRHLGPMLLLRLARNRRRRLVERFMRTTTTVKLNLAIERAFCFLSNLGKAMPALGAVVDESYPRRTDRPPKSSSIVGAADWAVAPALDGDAPGGKEPYHQNAAEGVRAALREMSLRIEVRVYLQHEVIQWLREPGHEVLLLLGGSVRRFLPTVASPIMTGFPFCSSFVMGSRLSSSVRSVRSAGGESNASRRSSAPLPDTHGRRGSTASATGAPPLSLAALSATPKNYVLEEEVLAAPQVFGENACLGGFPFCARLVAESEYVIVASVPKRDYCDLVSIASEEVQRRLLSDALKERETLLPYYSPLTRSRMRLCPLLSTLANRDLDHLIDHVIPKLYPAGSLCGESSDPRHIFFIYRGLVRMENEGFASVASASEEYPRSRNLLVDGHTFGEAPCINRECLGDVFYAVSHVEMYLLPFQVLIQLMKQQPEVQSVVYSSARALSLMREAPVKGMRFRTSRREWAEEANLGTGGDAIVPRALLPEKRESTTLILGEESLPAPFSRRVTIFEDDATEGRGKAPTGGRISPGLLTAMSTIPLLATLAPPEFWEECTKCWKCNRYQSGDYIVRRGEECNRVLLFYEGRAGVVMAEQLLRLEMELLSAEHNTGHFSSVAMASRRAVRRIPQGHMIGYTCVRRHRWAHSVVAIDGTVEVWELKRGVLVFLLRKYGLEDRMHVAVQQLLQPLMFQRERLSVLDYNPLLRCELSSLWSEVAIPNMHPVSFSEAPLFPAWKVGDFPLDRLVENGVAGGRRISRLGRTGSMLPSSVLREQLSESSHAVEAPHQQESMSYRAEFVQKLQQVKSK